LSVSCSFWSLLSSILLQWCDYAATACGACVLDARFAQLSAASVQRVQFSTDGRSDAGSRSAARAMLYLSS